MKIMDPLLAWRKKMRPSAELVVAFGILWIVWLVEGFTFNLPTHDLRNPDVLAELLNATTKTAMILAWASPSLGLDRWFRRRWGLSTRFGARSG